jgi:hypothetical protein
MKTYMEVSREGIPLWESLARQVSTQPCLGILRDITCDDTISRADLGHTIHMETIDARQV